jgi:peptide/nickel transport system ATP-binding protein
MHPYTQALLSAIPIPNPKRKRKRIELIGEVPSAINIPTGCRFHPRCPYKKDECSKKDPPIIEVEKEHFVACHFIKSRNG